MAQTLPYGRQKGVDIEKAETENNVWVLERLEEKIVSEPDGRFAESNRKLAQAIRAELKRRGAEAPEAPTQQAAGNGGGGAAPKAAAAGATDQSIERVGNQSIAFIGSFVDSGRVNAAMQAAESQCHLVAPATVCGSLPDLCEVAISAVYIDPNGPDVYQVTGDKKKPSDTDQMGLDRVALAKVLGAAGGDIVSVERLEPSGDPLYWVSRVTIRVRFFDGRSRRLIGVAVQDAREGSPMIRRIRTKAANRLKKYPKDFNDGGETEILELRNFLSRRADTMALNIATRRLGVRTSYARKSLQKPFAVAQLMVTGRSQDPEARWQYRTALLESVFGNEEHKGAQERLYGAPAQSAPAALPPPPVAPPRQLQPPPVGSVPEPEPYDEEEIETEGEPAAAPSETKTAEPADPNPPPADPPKASPAQPASQQAPAAQAGRAGTAGRTAGKAAPAAPPGQRSFSDPIEDPEAFPR